MAKNTGDKQKEPKPNEAGAVLNEQQEKFCKLYAYGPNRGNGVLSYAEAYGIDISDKNAYNAARSSSCRLLTNSNILATIRGYYETEGGLNETMVDNELAFVIQQNSDFLSKINAIKHYNELHNRVKDRENKMDLKITITKSGGKVEKGGQ